MTRPPRRKSMSPQQKKAASYAKDRRNDYGESPHGSRKNIPRARARAQRKLRHADKAALGDLEAAVERVPLRLRKPKWKKSPDVSLGLHLRRRRLREALNGFAAGDLWPDRWTRRQ
jgi:hypothetical protein